MTNKQLYNLVFENYIQAKKELIREGYLKREESNKIDFNEIFSATKGAMQEKKIEKLQRENQMLKEKLSQRRGLEEAGTMSAAAMGKQGGGAGTKGFGRFMNTIGSTVFKHGGSTAELASDELDDAKDADGFSFFDRMMYATKTGKEGLISRFKILMTTNLKNGMSKENAKRKAMADMEGTLDESKRRRRY